MKATKTEDRAGEYGACWSFPNNASVEQHLDGIDTGVCQSSYSRYVVDHYVVWHPMLPSLIQYSRFRSMARGEQRKMPRSPTPDLSDMLNHAARAGPHQPTRSKGST